MLGRSDAHEANRLFRSFRQPQKEGPRFRERHVGIGLSTRIGQQGGDALKRARALRAAQRVHNRHGFVDLAGRDGRPQHLDCREFASLRVLDKADALESRGDVADRRLVHGDPLQVIVVGPGLLFGQRRIALELKRAHCIIVQAGRALRVVHPPVEVEFPVSHGARAL